MAKNKNKQKKTRSKKNSSVKADLSYAKPGNSQGSIGNVTSSVLSNQTAGLCNPWSPHAKGSKVPDSENSKSVPYTMVWHKSLTTDANGALAVNVRGRMASSLKQASLMTSSQVTTWDADENVTNYSEYSTAFDRFRIVSWGIRMYSTLAPTEQAGTIRIITSPESANNGQNYDGSLFEEVVTIPLSTKDIFWVSKAQGISARDYVSYSTTANYWDSLFVAVTGAKASSTALTMEITMNVEAQINFGSVTATLATPSATHKPHVMQAHSSVMSRVGSAILSPLGAIVNMFDKEAKKELMNAARESAPYVRAAAGYLKNNPQLLQLAM